MSTGVEAGKKEKTISRKNVLHGHGECVWGLDIFAYQNRQFLVSVGGGKNIMVWDLGTNQLIYLLRGHKSKVYRAVSFNNGSPMIVSVSNDATLKIWDVLKGTCVKSEQSAIISLATYHINSKPMLVGGGQSFIQIWRLDNYDLVNTIKAHSNFVKALHVFYDETKPYLVTGSWDKTTKIWCMTKFECLTTIQNMNPVGSLTVINAFGKKLLAIGDTKGFIEIFDLSDYMFHSTIMAHNKCICELDVVLYKGSFCLVSVSPEYQIKVWNVDSDVPKEIMEHQISLQTVKAYCYEGKYWLASGDANGNITLYTVNSS